MENPKETVLLNLVSLIKYRRYYMKVLLKMYGFYVGKYLQKGIFPEFNTTSTLHACTYVIT